MWKSSAIAAATCAFALSAGWSTQASAATLLSGPAPLLMTSTYTFTGTCALCSTPGTLVSGKLVLAGYTAGNALSLANIRSFTYNGIEFLTAEMLDRGRLAQQRIDDRQQAVTTLQSQIAATEQTLSLNQLQRSMISAKITALEKRGEGIKKQQRIAQARASAVQRRLVELEKQKRSFEKHCRTNCSAGLEDVNNAIEQANADLAELAARYDELTVLGEGLRGQISSLQTESKRLEADDKKSIAMLKRDEKLLVQEQEALKKAQASKDLIDVSGGLSGSKKSAEDLFLGRNGGAFETRLDGYFSALVTDGVQTVQEAGIDGTWSVTSTSGPPSPIPEPATWALALGGLALVGASLRWRRRVVVRFA